MARRGPGHDLPASRALRGGRAHRIRHCSFPAPRCRPSGALPISPREEQRRCVRRTRERPGVPCCPRTSNRCAPAGPCREHRRPRILREAVPPVTGASPSKREKPLNSLCHASSSSASCLAGARPRRFSSACDAPRACGSGMPACRADRSRPGLRTVPRDPRARCRARPRRPVA